MTLRANYTTALHSANNADGAQNRNDANDHHQLNECESLLSVHICSLCKVALLCQRDRAETRGKKENEKGASENSFRVAEKDNGFASEAEIPLSGQRGERALFEAH